MFEEQFLSSVVKRFGEYKLLGERCFAQLGDGDFHWQANAASNSIAVIIRHLHGNMLSRWTAFLTEDGEKPWRQRDAEFEEGLQSREALLALWEEGWKVLLDTLSSLQPEDLARTITIRSQPHGVIDAINRQLAHYSYHVGQIVYLGRAIRNSQWTSLSIPKGDSIKFQQEMERKFGREGHNQ